MSKHNQTPNRSKNLKQKADMPPKSDIGEKLSKIGNLGKKLDKSHATKRTFDTQRLDQSPLQKVRKRKKSSGVSLLGGLQDVGRYRIIWGVMAVCFLALFARAYWLQIANADYYINQGDKLITTKRTITAHRGNIYDTNDAPLAANAPLTTVIFSPYDYALAYYDLQKKIKNTKNQQRRQNLLQQLDKMNLETLAATSGVSRQTLEQAVDLDGAVDLDDPDAIKQALPSGTGSKRLVLLSRVSPEVAGRILVLNFKGVFKETSDKRYYLQPEPMAQILGYMGYSQDDSSIYGGRTGIEAKYDKKLTGKDGQVLSLRAVQGSIGDIKEISAVMPGQDIHLTIDSRLQYILYKELEELGRVQSARSSSGMIVDVQTGNVLAMASWPSFNPNDLSKRHGASERNRPVLDTFEPGSVVKPLTVAAALESGRYNTQTLIDTGAGNMRLGRYLIRDGGRYGVITMGKLIQKSSNVASAKIALDLPPDAIVNMQRKFGFGQKTTLDLPAESAGVLKTPTAKDISRRATLAYGYGQSVTLAQIAGAYATLANGGRMNHLRLIKEESVPDPKQVISEQHAKDITNMMISVTEKGGTGQAAAIDGYYVAGKSGTSRRSNPKGGYYTDQFRNIFAGFAPATDPRFVVVVLVEDPRQGKYAGQTVAPVFAKVMKETLRIYSVPFDKPLDLHQ